MAAQATPIILLGRSDLVGRPITEALKPDIEVIHFINSADLAAKDIPLLFSEKQPTNPTFKGLGTQDYSRRPEAVITGGFFTISMVEDLIENCGGTQGVPWLTAGLTEEQRDANETKALDPVRYAPMVAKRVKQAIERVKAEGNWNRDGVYNY